MNYQKQLEEEGIIDLTQDFFKHQEIIKGFISISDNECHALVSDISYAVFLYINKLLFTPLYWWYEEFKSFFLFLFFSRYQL